MPPELARAKINLYLHVAAPDARGWHPLQSLVAFADMGDQVSLTDAPGLTIDGPFGAGLSAGEDNLILRAARRFEALAGVELRHGLHLDKQLPLASGIGGGSADAGATLRLLKATYAPQISDELLDEMAQATGADGVMCLRSQSAFAEGYGELLTPVKLPSMPCVLINPGVACSTPQVFAAYDALGCFEAIEAKQGFADIVNIDGLVAALKATRNDLESPAIRLQPVIVDVLTSLRDQPDVLLARMSGSGATCFALCRDEQASGDVAERMRVLWPTAWVRACQLG
jgi:4-diphosphocytidyl-2-C-methyl-D-erythritol kinase